MFERQPRQDRTERPVAAAADATRSAVTVAGEARRRYLAAGDYWFNEEGADGRHERHGRPGH
ncbi:MULTISPECIES: hypothetical protein [unclassified Streptomyces]|uniref:hypothetical protein n=1 Tax=unclassified Streptomyces TaxID=2593676 RepID=UPI002E2FA487|nr:MULTISPECIES: hypothetical protein [unclassified Streptomyces]WUC63750.1 hypothetical protein OG861_05640 [Streptomyces sp. NBC_00539]